MRGLILLLCALLGIAAVVLWKGRDMLTLQPPEAEGEGEAEDATFAKVHFMRKFVAALTEPPGNLMPSPSYAPLLKEGAAPIRCTDCHKSMDVEAKIATDPGDEAVQRFRMDPEGFMIPLMEKWVERLNKRHKDRLVREVTCTDCHAVDPSDDKARLVTFRPLMAAFTDALTEPPRNASPAKGWKPLLKAPAPVSCGACHRDSRVAPPPSAVSAAEPDRTFMIRLMERWVRELNRRMKDRLVKAVVCTDCHEIDPRK